MADDESPERSRTQNIADWTDITQQQGGTPSKVERVVDAVKRDETEPVTHSPEVVAIGDYGQYIVDQVDQTVEREANTNVTTPSDFEQPSPTPAQNARANPSEPAPEPSMSEDGGSWFQDDEAQQNVWSDAEQAMQQASDPIGSGIDAIGEATQNIYDGVSDAVQDAYDSFSETGGDFSDSGGESFSGDEGGGWE